MVYGQRDTDFTSRQKIYAHSLFFFKKSCQFTAEPLSARPPEKGEGQRRMVAHVVPPSHFWGSPLASTTTRGWPLCETTNLNGEKRKEATGAWESGTGTEWRRVNAKCYHFLKKNKTKMSAFMFPDFITGVLLGAARESPLGFSRRPRAPARALFFELLPPLQRPRSFEI